MQSTLPHVEKVVVALGMSLLARNLEAKYNDESLLCSMQIISFNSTATQVMPLSTGIDISGLLLAYNAISASGGTSDHTALNLVERQIDQGLQQAIKDRKRLELLIEITDGETSDSKLTIEALNRLNKAGVILGAIRIESDQGLKSNIFETIWRDRGMRISGVSGLGQALEDFLD